MPEIQAVANVNWVNVAVNIIVTVVAGYISLLVRSIRKENRIKTDGIEKLCEERYTGMKKNVDDLLVRARVLGTLEERLHSGSEQFSDIKKRLEDLECIIYRKGKR